VVSVKERECIILSIRVEDNFIRIRIIIMFIRIGGVIRMFLLEEE
jgi:hypothetical protein